VADPDLTPNLTGKNLTKPPSTLVPDALTAKSPQGGVGNVPQKSYSSR
jgi:hypothetical protein